MSHVTQIGEAFRCLIFPPSIAIIYIRGFLIEDVSSHGPMILEI